MKIWDEPQDSLSRSKKKTCFVLVIISDEIVTGMHPENCRKNSPEKVNTRIFQEKAVICFIYIPENFYYGNRYYNLD